MKVREVAWFCSWALSTATILEATAFPKPGNVHRLKDHEDTSIEHFVISGVASVEVFYRAFIRGYRLADSTSEDMRCGLGYMVYRLVRTCKSRHRGGNTNLGTATLLVPLAVALGFVYRRCGLLHIGKCISTACTLVKHSDVSDAVWFYRAIRVASPRYLRKRAPMTSEHPNVWDPNFARLLRERGITLYDVLLCSSMWDLISRELVEGYPLTQVALCFLRRNVERFGVWNDAVVETFLELLSRYEDTLVVAKRGKDLANELRQRACEVLRLGGVTTSSGMCLLWSLDAWASHNGINPGALADVLATAIALLLLTRYRI
ncbi:MAG: triphosphoribosyl-dephospho-CoA synthase [Thermoprotei archaeon]|nr:MAG: triphosphoribosyl-dephospho-CoA synthase [Thermoprotei archaeon]